MISDFSKVVESLKKCILKSKVTNVTSLKVRALANDVARDYFDNYRNELVRNNIDADLTKLIDDSLQDLLRLAQNVNRKSSYLKKIKAIEYAANELSIKEISKSYKNVIVHQTESILLTTIEAISPIAALSYKQAVLDLNDKNERISYRGTASELREALREVLDILAKDEDVMSDKGFKLEQNQTRPTMKQKVRYILKNRNLNDTKRLPTEKSTEMVDELIGQMTRAVYNRASLSTHVETTKTEVVKVKNYVDIVLHEILEITML